MNIDINDNLNRRIPIYRGMCKFLIENADPITAIATFYFNSSMCNVTVLIETQDQAVYDTFVSAWGTNIEIPELNFNKRAFIFKGKSKKVSDYFIIQCFIVGDGILSNDSTFNILEGFLFNGFYVGDLEDKIDLVYNQWEITITRIEGFKEIKNEFHEIGGYAISHRIQVKKSNGSFQLKEVEDTLELLSNFFLLYMLEN
ncbi:hypothetical protein [Leptospira kanakyensis]|uniref:YopA central domain-containing protein n=1 Tax=Leptospira kanakyensis TaxID=2484968 RepID=A0A6N4QHH5_9LEPT|nr:hypothetical protein [Leptospira kanakyensis]TGK46265.1 hypothetical protein EHQ11_18950 [Leptospira kanakyensis]TGK71500.1 hypothetical protein EHQ18_08235 [Leptospira kanakyensis]